jgi:crossover junction endodeoxyribonuclease RuvC
VAHRVLGVDPGSSATGWAVVEGAGNRQQLIASGVIRPRGADRAARLADLHRRLCEVLDRTTPDSAAVETPFTGRNPRSALALAEARGSVLAALGAAGIAVEPYTPASVKSAVVGTGAAEKGQVMYMVVRLLALDREPPSDAADAMAVALTHLRLSRWKTAR